MSNIKKIVNKIDKINKKKKIHRRYVPKLNCRIPKGIASKFISRISNHNWHYNNDLINFRRKLGIRIHARSELCETLTVLSSVLIAYCNYSLYSEYLFEIRAPFEIISFSMNMLHIYNNGRKSYDPPLHALHVLEKLKYLIILRDKNPDTGQYKPLRIWLTKRFFTSRGISLNELRFNLNNYENWVVRNNLTNNLLILKNRHLLKMRVIGIDLLKFPSLRYLLIKIKREILGKDFINKINNNIRLSCFNKNKMKFLGNILDNKNKVCLNFNRSKKKYRYWYSKFIIWSNMKMPHQIFSLEKSLNKESPYLRVYDSEKYYKILLKRGLKLNI